MVQHGGSLQRAVRIQLEKVVVGRAVAVREGKDEGGVGVGIGGVELAHDGSGGPVLLHGEETGNELGGNVVRVRGGVLRIGSGIHLGFVVVSVAIGVGFVRVGAEDHFVVVGETVLVGIGGRVRNHLGRRLGRQLADKAGEVGNVGQVLGGQPRDGLGDGELGIVG